MTANIDLNAYFQRIGFNGDAPATRDTLANIVAKHAAAIAFENLDPLSKQTVQLDAASLERKLIREHRGGYCFEHNLLLRNVLQQLGYKVTGLAARVRWNAPETLITARGHMVLRIELEDGSHILDVGFGGLTLTGVLKLQPDIAQATPHESFRLIQSDGEFVMQADIRGEWRAVYRFDLQEQHPIDYEPINWYLSTSPQSHFTQHLMAARALSDRRYALRNNQFTTHFLTGRSEQRALTSTDELRAALETEFAIAVPRTAAMQSALARVVGA